MVLRNAAGRESRRTLSITTFEIQDEGIGDKSLVVFDLYKRGSGSKRQIIRTDKIIVPPLDGGKWVFVDSGKYQYETEKYRSIYGSSYDDATAEEFYGYVVSIFDEQGKLYYQRATNRVLNDYARTSPPE